jgi:putative inorganic carbon (HCO3(-)) transporter
MAVLTAVGGLLLLLSQSRSGITAMVVCLGVLIALQGRAGRWIAAAGCLAILAVLVIVGPQTASRAFFAVDAAGAEVSLQGRLEIWHRSWRALRDHALTGIGFDTLVPVIHARYPTFYLKANGDFTHAHNHLLQVGLDLGVPGLVAYLALLTGYGWALAGVVRRAPSRWLRALALGLLLGMVGMMLFGVADTLELGQESSLLFWINLGLGLAAVQLSGGDAESARPSGAG